MNIPGMDYNTTRSRLPMPEYGRGIQCMVERCVATPDRGARQAAAERIVKAMELMHPAVRQQSDWRRKLWDDLVVMSGWRLDVDFPYPPVSRAERFSRPQAVPLVKRRVKVRHYGALVEQLATRLSLMPKGKERDELTRRVANQMKRDLIMYGNAGPDNERVIGDLAALTGGAVQLDPKKFTFEFIVMDKKQSAAPQQKQGRRRRRR